MTFRADTLGRATWHRFALLCLLLWGGYQLHAQDTNPPAPEPTVPSLVSNGDFSVATKDPSRPDDWALPKGVTWETENGVHFIRLTSTTPGEMVLVYRKVDLPTPLPPGIELRIRVRYAGVKVGKNSWFDARVMGNFKTTAGKGIKKGGELPAPNFTGSSTEWVDRSVFVRVPSKASSVEIMPCLLQPASGTFDVAQVNIYPATENQLPKPPPVIPSVTIVPKDPKTVPPELHAAGNQLQTGEGKAVWLQGLCLDSMQWTAGGEHIQQSLPVAIDQWHANVIRLPVRDDFWFGVGPWQKKGEGGISYRQLVDDTVEFANSRGAYLVLDLHKFGPPTDDDVKFWKDAAVRYKNHPGVIFELFNEPHSMSWKVWRDGGLLHGPENAHIDLNAKENNEADDDDERTPGMQALVDAVRSTGARNLVIAGGLDWGYNLSGTVKDFPLHDPPGNDGIMYSSHIYPWKKDWQINTLDAAAKYPIFVGEVGCPDSWDGYKFIPENERYETLGAGCPWPEDVIGMFQKYKLNWTGFSFHPHCGPQAISDWNYTPTPNWGVYVKDALAGKQYEVKRMR